MNTLTEQFCGICNRSKRRVTILSNRNTPVYLTYTELYSDALTVLKNLQAKHLDPGTEIVLHISNIRSFLCTFWACILGRITAVPVSPARSEAGKLKVLNILKVLKCPKLITDDESNVDYVTFTDCFSFKDLVTSNGSGEIIPADPEDLAFIQFSSGSTGNPKGVMLTHSNLITNAFDIIDGFGIQPGGHHKFLGWLPLSHDLGLIGCHLTPTLGDLDHVLMPPELFLKRPHVWLNSMSEFKATVTASPNFGFQYVLEHFSENHYKDTDLSHLRACLNAAEPISVNLCETFLSRFKQYGLKEGVLSPGYGLAEASVGVCCNAPGKPIKPYNILRKNTHIGDPVVICDDDDPAAVKFPEVGIPFTNCHVRIANDKSDVMDEQTIGRIQIKGDNVTQGYYNNEKATQEAFTIDGWLDTGDIGFKINNALVITGRAKEIIFINGQNFFPHDLEMIVNDAGLVFPGKIAIAGFSDQNSGTEKIAAFIVHKGDPSQFKQLTQQCNTAIKEKTGVSIHYFVPVPKIPKTTSGKIQRHCLLEEFNAGIYKDCTIAIETSAESIDQTPPENRREIVLHNAWCKVLKHKKIGIHDDFFKLGGDSIKATLILVEIQNEGFTIRHEYIFKTPTIAEAAKYMEPYIQKESEGTCTETLALNKQKTSIETATNSDSSLFNRENIQDIYTLTPMQEGMYYFNKLDMHSGLYFQQLTFTMQGNWSEAVLEESLKQLIARHDILRTVFVENLSDRLLQVVFKQWKHDFCYRDISHLDETSQKQYINDFRIDDCNRPFNLNKGVLFRLTVFRLATKTLSFYWSYHHILFDGWCTTIILRDFFYIYFSLKNKQPVNLPQLYPYREFIRWLEKQDHEQSIRYWKNYLNAHSSTSGFPKIKDCLEIHENDERRLNIMVVEDSVYTRIKDLSASYKTTPNVFFQTAWSILLAKYCGKNDIVFGAVTSGRPAEVSGVENMVGLFVNTIPVRIIFNQSETFSNLLVRTQQNALESNNYQYGSLAHIQSALGKKGDLFDHILAYQNHPIFDRFEGQEENSALNKEISEIEIAGVTNYNLDVEFVQADKFKIKVIFNPNMYSVNLIENLLLHLKNIIAVVLERPDIPICDIEFLSEQEKRQQLEVFNHIPASAPVAGSNLHDQFEAQALKTPGLPAVTFQNKTIDYITLNKRANQLAHLLKKKGIAAGELIGIYTDRSIESIISILAIWKAGGAYLPISTSQPVLRTIEVLKDCCVSHVITTEEYSDKVNFGCDVIVFEDYSLSDQPVNDLKLKVHPDQLCYAITTSGSTGKPKAVMIRHKELSGLISVFDSKLGLNCAPLQVLQMANFVFDVFLGDVCRTLPFGGHLVICPEEVRAIPQALYDYIISKKISFIETTPALVKPLFAYMISSNLEIPDIKAIAIGGDTLHMEDYRTFRRYLPQNIRLINSYGIAECTVDSSWFEESSDYQYGGHATPIGKPLSYNRLYILDQFGKMAPVGVAGELCIAGPSVGAGYLGDPVRTSEKFTEDPFVNGERMYRSGDNGRWLCDGNMEFLGRRDFQIKIRGNRVELGEIEGKILSFSGITEAVAVVRNINGKDCIVAFYCAKTAINADLLKSYLIDLLPDYMIPSTLISLESMPLNANRKIDRNALKSIPIDFDPIGNQTERPANETETLLLNIWKKVLKNEKIGIFDDFFLIGGDSIVSIQIQAALRKEGYQHDLRDLFHYPTVAALAPRLKPVRKKADQGVIFGTAPLTPIQHWFFNVQTTNTHHYNHSVSIFSEERFNTDHVKSAFHFLITHHDALRMLFKYESGSLHQTNTAEPASTTIDNFELSTTGNNSPELITIINKLQTELDLEKGPLYKVAHFKCIDGDRLVVIIHHLVVDGISWRILIEDIQTLFNQLKNRKTLSLPEKTDAFIHWADALNSMADTKPILREKDFWKKIDESPVSPIPFDREGETCRYKHLKSVSVTLGPDKTKSLLTEIHGKYNTSMEDILLAATSLSMNQTFCMDYIPISLESHGRDVNVGDLCINRTVGWFTSYHPVIIKASEKDDVDKTIRVVKETLRQVHNDGIGYGVLKYLTSHHLKQDITFKVIPEIEFNYLGQFKNIEAPDNALTITGMVGETVSPEAETGVEMIITASIPDDTLLIRIEYNRTKFDNDTMDKLMKNIETSLDIIIAHCVSKSDSTLTPSDVSEENLTIDELDEINALVEDLE